MNRVRYYYGWWKDIDLTEFEWNDTQGPVGNRCGQAAAETVSGMDIGSRLLPRSLTRKFAKRLNH